MKNEVVVHPTIKSTLLSILSLCLITGPINLNAQQLEEVVVTAQRREQSLQEVPISINVYSGEQIDLQGYENLDRSRMYNGGHWDMNLSGGFGPQDGSWKITGFVRNLREDRIIFRPEYDLTRSGIKFSEDRVLSKASFRSYGIRFEYNYR